MLPGLSGHLVSESFLEHELTSAAGSLGPDVERARIQLGAWRRSSAWLGPSAAVRTLFEAAGVSLVELLGFEPPTAIELAGTMLASTILAGGDPIAWLVLPWGARLDAMWRPAVLEAQRRSARWTLLFNGTHVRVVDATRVYARRSAEFDVDLMLDHERTCLAFWLLLRAEALSNGGAENVSLRASRIFETW